MISDKDFQEIFEILNGFLPEAWERMVIYLEYGEDSYSMSFYIKKNNKYVKCYDLPGVTEDELMKAFGKIDKNVYKKQKQEGWSNCTIIIDSSRKIHADFDYTDLSEGTYKYHKDWKKKYLV